MSAQVWQIISIVGYSLSAVLLVTSLFLFFKFRTITLIGELNGHNIARQVEEIREENKKAIARRQPYSGRLGTTNSLKTGNTREQFTGGNPSDEYRRMMRMQTGSGTGRSGFGNTGNRTGSSNFADTGNETVALDLNSSDETRALDFDVAGDETMALDFENTGDETVALDFDDGDETMPLSSLNR